MIWTIDNQNCEYCGETFTSSNVSTIDHLIPKSKFKAYSKERWTFVKSCLRCNRKKDGYINLSIPFLPENRDALIEDVRINKLKVKTK